MNQKGIAFIPLLFWLVIFVTGVVAISKLTSFLLSADSTQVVQVSQQTSTQTPITQDTDPLEECSIHPKCGGGVKFVKQNECSNYYCCFLKDGNSLLMTKEKCDHYYEIEDSVVDCRFKSGTIKIKSSECKNMVDCQIGDKWIPATKEDCELAQGEREKSLVDDLVKSIKERNTYFGRAPSGSSGGSSSLGETQQPSLSDTKEKKSPIIGRGSYYTDSLGNTYYYGNDGTSGTAYTDSLGNTYYSDSTGYSSTTTRDSLGNSYTTDNQGHSITTNRDSLGNTYYGGTDGLSGMATKDSLGNTYYSDNFGNSISCHTDSLGNKTCY